MNILIVDDDPIARLIIRQNLSHISLSNLQIQDAVNGKEALSLISENRLDVILLDLNMPIMNGFDVLNALKEQESTIPVYIITSSNLVEDRMKCEAFSMVKGFFEKPITHGALDILLTHEN
jgi:CheY-like chemotaxis protein